jgi:hypothetical protein
VKACTDEVAFLKRAVERGRGELLEVICMADSTVNLGARQVGQCDEMRYDCQDMNVERMTAQERRICR